MNNYKIIDIQSLGKVKFIKRKTGKNIIISFKNGNDYLLRISFPKYITYYQAKSFINQNLDTIKNKLTKINENTQKQKNKLLPKINNNEAKLYLEDRINSLSQKFNLPFNKVKIKKLTSIWGSCSYKNNISLNINLARLPLELQDYVIIHELAHTKIKNHQKEFWLFVDNILSDNSKKLRKELKKYSFLNHN